MLAINVFILYTLITIASDRESQDHETDIEYNQLSTGEPIAERTFLSLEKVLDNDLYVRRFFSIGYLIFAIVLCALAEFATDFGLPGRPRNSWVSIQGLLNGQTAAEQNAIYSLSGTLANGCARIPELIFFLLASVSGIRSVLATAELHPKVYSLSYFIPIVLTVSFSLTLMLLIWDNNRQNDLHGPLSTKVFLSFLASAIIRVFANAEFACKKCEWRGFRKFLYKLFLDSRKSLAVLLAFVLLLCAGQNALGHPVENGHAREDTYIHPAIFNLKGTVLEYSYLPYMVTENLVVWSFMLTHFSVWDDPSFNDREVLEEAKTANPPRVAIPTWKFGIAMATMVLSLVRALQVTWWERCLNPFTNDMSECANSTADTYVTTLIFSMFSM